jgi:cell division protein YceG involved in septum cleavage
MYFVARGDGGHHFSVTYKEHLAAKEKYRVKK